MTDFYVTLPSNVPNAPFHNTTSRYVTRLPEVLQLQRDEWVVALTDLVYPHSFVNVGRPLHYWIHFKGGRQPIRVTFPAADYSNLEGVISALNNQVHTRMKRSAVDNVIEENLKKAKREMPKEEKESILAILNEKEKMKSAQKTPVIQSTEAVKQSPVPTPTSVPTPPVPPPKKIEEEKKTTPAPKKIDEKKIDEKKVELKEEKQTEQTKIEPKQEKKVEEKKTEQKEEKKVDEKKPDVIKKPPLKKPEEPKPVIALSPEMKQSMAEYAAIANNVLNRPNDATTYRNMMEEFERIRSLVSVDKPDYDTNQYLGFTVQDGKVKINFLNPAEVLFVEFDKACGYFLGFEDTIVRESSVAPHKVDFFGDVSVIYLYSDLVDPIIVGNRKSNLLSVIPCTGKYGSIIYYTVPNPRYVPLINSNIDSIRIELLTDGGDPIPFSWGTTIAVLHFKKIK
ncbi:hypothetical protein CRE_12168 [Caenorhabditis remanei]|uniref:Uncharacterized protein n=1 Tax=Caenorhabditis remanei TaxID=31234 RepID=E3N0B6_CAERE|nr:hypothetical protein CRE_12168 [Caenorhabditis remanei]